MRRKHVWWVRSACGLAAVALAVGARPALGVGLLEAMDLEIRQGALVLLSVTHINTVGKIDGMTAINLGPAANGTEVLLTVTLDEPLVADWPDRLIRLRINGQLGGSPASLFDPLDDGDIEIHASNMVFTCVDPNLRPAPCDPLDYGPMGLGFLPFFYAFNRPQGFLDLPGAAPFGPPFPTSVQIPMSGWIALHGYGFAEIHNHLKTGMALTGIPDVSGVGAGHAGAPNVIAVLNQDPPLFTPPMLQDNPGFVDEVSISVNMRDVPVNRMLTGGVSRKTHGAAGVFDIPLPVVCPDPPGIECRAGGPTLVVLTFVVPIQAADGTPDGTEVALSAGTLHSVSIAGNQMSIDLSGVPDATCLRITLSGLEDLGGNPVDGDDNEVVIGVLYGDQNGDRQVSIIDLLNVKSDRFAPVTGANFRSDVTADGVINIVDLNEVKHNRFATLGPCP